MDTYAQIADQYARLRGTATLQHKMLVAIAREEAQVYGEDEASRQFLDDLYECALGDDQSAFLADPEAACL